MREPPHRLNVAVIILLIAVCSIIAIGVGIVGAFKWVSEASTSIPATESARSSATEQAQRAATETQAVYATSTASASRAEAIQQAEAAMVATATSRSQ